MSESVRSDDSDEWPLDRPVENFASRQVSRDGHQSHWAKTGRLAASMTSQSNPTCLHDLTIRLGPLEVVTNAAVMAGQSSFFEAKIQAEGDGPFEVRLDERKLTAAGLKVAVEFCYTAEAKTTLADLTEVFGAAKYLQMADLRNSVERQMVKLASNDQTAMAALKLTTTNPVSPVCRRLVIQAVAERFGQIPPANLKELDAEDFCALLDSPKLDRKFSYATAQRVVEWLEAKPNRIDMASRLIHLLNIPEMTDTQAKPTLKLLADHKIDWVSAVDTFRDGLGNVVMPPGEVKQEEKEPTEPK